MAEKKYKLIESSRSWMYGRPIHRIQALRDFSDVKKGDLGGFVESEGNLSQGGDCWIYDMAQAMEKSRVEDDACLRDCAKMYGSSILKDKAQLQGCARMIQYACLADNAVAIDAEISGFATITGDVIIRRKEDYMVFSDIPKADFYATYTFPNKRWSFILFEGTSKEFIKAAPFNDRKRRELIVQIVEEIEKQNKKQTTTITMEQQADRRLTGADFRNCKKYTRNSTEMLEIRMKHGLAGYAVAVMLLEKMEESNNREVERNYDAIGFEFRADSATIKKVVEDNTLFQISANGKITIKGQ